MTNELYAELPEDVVQSFKKAERSLELKRGDTVYVAGESPRGIFLVEKGLVGLTVSSENGAEHFTRFFASNTYFGHRSLFAQEPYHARATVLTETSLKVVPQEAITWALENIRNFQLAVIKKLARELKFAELRQFELSDSDVLERVASSIVHLKSIDPNYAWTRQEIANFCGSTVSKVIRALGELASRGLIDQSGREITVHGDKLKEVLLNRQLSVSR